MCLCVCVCVRESNLLKKGTKIHDDSCHNRGAGQIPVPEKTKRVYTEKGDRTHAEKTERQHKSQVDMSEDKVCESEGKARTGEREHAKGPGHRAFLSLWRPPLCPVGMASIARSSTS